MRLAYVDTSCLVAIAFGEPGHQVLARRLAGFDRLLTSNLTEAELRAALRREKVDGPGRLLDEITWVFPDRVLTAEYERILSGGYMKGADLFHLACALYLRSRLGELTFETVDQRQVAAARALGM